MRKIALLIVIASVALSCKIDETYFGESDNADIVYFDIQGQMTNQILPKWSGDTGKVTIGIPQSLDIYNLTVSRVQLSPLAKFDFNPFNKHNFRGDTLVWITAENQNVRKPWIISVGYADAQKQLDYSDMRSWVKALDQKGGEIFTGTGSNKTYAYFPGAEGYQSPWQTAAHANKFVGEFTSNPQPNPTNAEFASLNTIMFKAGQIVKAGIVSGALFAGYFRFDQSHIPVIGSDPNPRKMVDFGRPFYERPTSFRLKYRYLPGEKMLDGSGNEILQSDTEKRPYKDSCDIFVLLQNRTLYADKWVRVGAGWHRSSEAAGNILDENGFVTLTVPIVYGKPSAQQLLEKPYLNTGGCRGEVIFYKFSLVDGTSYSKTQMPEEYPNDPSTVSVDHIIVNFVSSAYGDSFWGAPGSRLDIKDFELLYE